MHKYQPRIHLVLLKPQENHHQLNYSTDPDIQTPHSMTSSAVTLTDLELISDSIRTFVFTETMFTAVTAYQNQLVLDNIANNFIYLFVNLGTAVSNSKYF